MVVSFVLFAYLGSQPTTTSEDDGGKVEGEGPSPFEGGEWPIFPHIICLGWVLFWAASLTLFPWLAQKLCENGWILPGICSEWLGIPTSKETAEGADGAQTGEIGVRESALPLGERGKDAL